MDADRYAKLTPKQKALLAVLADGKEHPREELWAVLGDPLLDSSTLAVHLNGIRKMLSHSREIIHVFQRMNGDPKKKKTYYQWLKLVPREAR